MVQDNMRCISSRSTSFYKRVFPILIILLVAMITLPPAAVALTSDDWTFMVPAIPAVIFLAILFPVLKRAMFDLVDEVRDDGDALIVRNGGKESRIAFADIKNVRFERLTGRIVLLLGTPCALGQKIAFCTSQRWSVFAPGTILDELIHRVDVARQR